MKLNLVVVLLLIIAGLFVLGPDMTSIAGNLEPTEAPGSTMVTLQELSDQIQAISGSNVNKIVRGTVQFPPAAFNSASATVSLTESINPQKSLVILSPVVINGGANTRGDRSGAALAGLTASTITIQAEPLDCDRMVSYQIIEYK